MDQAVLKPSWWLRGKSFPICVFSWDAPSDISIQRIDLYEEGSSVLFIRLHAAVSEPIVFHVSRTTEDSHAGIPQRVFSSATTRQLNWILYYFWLIDDPPSWLSPPWSLQLWNHSVLDYRECCFTERDVFWLFLFFLPFLWSKQCNIWVPGDSELHQRCGHRLICGLCVFLQELHQMHKPVSANTCRVSI